MLHINLGMLGGFGMVFLMAGAMAITAIASLIITAETTD